MTALFSVGPLDTGVDRSGFACGIESLDRYFHTQVSQDVRRRVTACFVATDRSGRIAGYYALAAASVMLNDLPAANSRTLPRHPSVPAVRMGRLAVDHRCRGEGLGSALLADALRRVATTEIAAFALLVDAKDASAAAFYAHHGFLPMGDQSLMLFLPLATVKPLIE